AMLLLPSVGAGGGLVILIALTTVGKDMQRVRTLGGGWRGENRGLVRHPPPGLGGRRLQEGAGGEGRGGGIRRGPRAAGEGARRPHGRCGRGARTAARAPRQVSAEARLQRLRVVPWSCAPRV